MNPHEATEPTCSDGDTQHAHRGLGKKTGTHLQLVLPCGFGQLSHGTDKFCRRVEHLPPLQLLPQRQGRESEEDSESEEMQMDARLMLLPAVLAALSLANMGRGRTSIALEAVDTLVSKEADGPTRARKGWEYWASVHRLRAARRRTGHVLGHNLARTRWVAAPEAPSEPTGKRTGCAYWSTCVETSDGQGPTQVRGEVYGHTLTRGGWAPSPSQSPHHESKTEPAIQDAAWYQAYMTKTVPSTSKDIWSADNTMSKQASAAFHNRLASIFAPEGSSSRTRSAYQTYLHATHTNDFAVRHGAEQLVLTTPQLLPCNHKGAIRCRLS